MTETERQPQPDNPEWLKRLQPLERVELPTFTEKEVTGR